MRGFALFAAGLVLGGVLVQSVSAQSHGIRLNHVGMNVRNIEETLNFYKSIGVREAFTVRDAEGKATMAYLHISRETFMEVALAGPDRPAGITHFGIEADAVKVSKMRLEQTGVKVEDVRVSRTNTLLTSAIDPSGIRFELAQIPPDSLVGKAIRAWK